MNSYAYVEGNPLSNIDPKGLNTIIGPGGIPVPIITPGTPINNNPGQNHPLHLPPPQSTSQPIQIPAITPTTITLPFLCVLHPVICSNIVFAKPPSNAYDPNGSKAPGKPSTDDGFCAPKGGDEWVPNPNGKGHGWLDKNGDVWVPTGNGSSAHGGPHWDVQKPGGSYENVYPGGRRR